MIPYLTDKPKSGSVVPLPTAQRKPAPPIPIYWLWAMAEGEVPKDFLSALRAYIWIAWPFIFFLVGVERIFDAHGHWYEALACFILTFASIFVAVYWDSLLSVQFRRLKYLESRDSTLGPAIVSMGLQSAWGKWFAAQHLANNGIPINHRYLFQTAASVVMDKILDGELAVRGRRPGRLEYEDIPRTHWRSSAFYIVDDPRSLWRVQIAPRGGVQIEPDGTVHASDAIATQRTAQLDYDSFIVDAHQFEKLWPRRQWLTDRKRRKFLRDARRRKLDKNEIQRLSR